MFDKRWFNFWKNPHKRETFILWLMLVLCVVGAIYADIIAEQISRLIFYILEALFGLPVL